MATKNVRALAVGDRINVPEVGMPDLIRSVEVVASMASGRAVVFTTPSNVEVLPPEEEISEADLQAIDGADQPAEEN